MFFKTGYLKIFTSFTGKSLCWGLFLTKLQTLCNFMKNRLQHRCFPVKFTKFFRTYSFTKHLRWLLLGAGIHGNRNFLGKFVSYIGVVGIIHRMAYFRALIAFEKLKHQPRFKAVEVSTLNDYKSQLLMQTQAATSHL